MKGTILGVPIMRTIVFWGLYLGPPILGNYHLDYEAKFQLRMQRGLPHVILSFESEALPPQYY